MRNPAINDDADRYLIEDKAGCVRERERGSQSFGATVADILTGEIDADILGRVIRFNVNDHACSDATEEVAEWVRRALLVNRCGEANRHLIDWLQEHCGLVATTFLREVA